jgi:hypothetical protein
MSGVDVKKRSMQTILSGQVVGNPALMERGDRVWTWCLCSRDGLWKVSLVGWLTEGSRSDQMPGIAPRVGLGGSAG